MDWTRDGRDWPNAEASRFVVCRPHHWHVQVAGRGPVALLLHGAGGATQSWRGLFPLLARRFTVVAPDFPGQGFTRLGARMRCGLGPLAEDIATLCAQEGWAPDLIVGHSAGAAVGLQMAMTTPPRAVVGINAALGTFEGVAGWLFPVMARMLALNPVVPPLFARFAGSEKRVRDLLDSTGSTIHDEGIALYRRLVSDSGHVDATLAMMAQWRLNGLLDHLPQITTPTLLMVGDRDRSVPPATSERAAHRLPNATLRHLPGLGHLAHEEAPALVASAIDAFWDGLPG